jgi:hypothetical protein
MGSPPPMKYSPAAPSQCAGSRHWTPRSAALDAALRPAPGPEVGVVALALALVVAAGDVVVADRHEVGHGGLARVEAVEGGIDPGPLGQGGVAVLVAVAVLHEVAQVDDHRDGHGLAGTRLDPRPGVGADVARDEVEVGGTRGLARCLDVELGVRHHEYREAVLAVGRLHGRALRRSREARRQQAGGDGPRAPSLSAHRPPPPRSQLRRWPA